MKYLSILKLPIQIKCESTIEIQSNIQKNINVNLFSVYRYGKLHADLNRWLSSMRVEVTPLTRCFSRFISM